MSKAATLLTQAINAPSIAHRKQAVADLSGVRLDDEDYQQLNAALASHNSTIRQRTAAVLGHLLATPEVQQLLRVAMRDPSWVTREESISSVVRHVSDEDDEWIGLLVDLSLYDRNRIIRESARSRILELTSARSIGLLLPHYRSAMSDRRHKVRCRALAVLGGLAKSSDEANALEIISLISTAISDSSHRVRNYAIYAAIESDGAVKHFLPLVAKRKFDKNFDVQRTAMDFLRAARRNVDELMRDALKVTTDISDPGVVLAHLFRVFRAQLNDSIGDTCKRRRQWHSKILGMTESSFADDGDVVACVNEVIALAGFRQDGDQAKRSEQIWFIGKLFDGYLNQAVELELQ